MQERMRSVLAVVYLIFNEGYTATAGDRLTRDDLCAEAIRLGRLIAELLPEHPEASGLLLFDPSPVVRLNRAVVAYEAAIARTANASEREFLRRRWQNGVMPMNYLAGKFVEFMIGWQSFSNAKADVWMDDLVLSTGPIGCN